jgi:biotin carboxylase
MNSGRRPRLALVHGEGLGMPMILAESADAAGCDLVWVIDSATVTSDWLMRLLRKLGTTLDIAGMSDDEAAEALRACEPDGIIAYAEPLIPIASALAVRLGLDYHDEATTRRLTDKFAQRQALRDAGLPVPRFVVVPGDPSAEEIDALMTSVDFPVVLKPRRGAAGRDTVLARDPDELRHLIAEHATPPGDTPTSSMIVEEYLVGASPPPSPIFADYVSVESVVSAGTISHLAVTGRFPLAPPFRESGFVIPSDLGPSDRRDVLDVASRAITALGVRVGFLHTEIKLTPDGPRVIEVNGRLGGDIPDMMTHAAGIDLLSMSKRVALGEHVVFDGLIPTSRVGYVFYVQAPQSARRVLRVEGLAELGELPGVDSVFLARQPGDDVDWREGSHQFVFSVIGAADDYEGVLATKRFVDEEVTMTFE